jgi:azurin
MTGLGTSTASSVRHEWLADTLSAVKRNAYAEGIDASYAVTDPTRVINYTQIIRQGNIWYI